MLHARPSPRPSAPSARLRAVGFLELGGLTCSGDGPERLEAVELDELERLLEGGAAELIDVREADERDGGYIAGSRTSRTGSCRSRAPKIRNGRPVVTICESGARAGVAASDPRGARRRRAAGARRRHRRLGGPRRADGRVPPLRLVSGPRLTELALFTADVAGVTAFYERVLGIAAAEQSDRHAVFTLGDLVLRIHVAVEPAPGDPPADDHVAFTVAALEEHAAALAAAGVAVEDRETSRGAAPPTCATPTAASSSWRRTPCVSETQSPIRHAFCSSALISGAGRQARWLRALRQLPRVPAETPRARRRAR